MARVFKAKYYPKQSLFEAKIKSQSSYAWRSISQGTHLLSYGLKYLVGNGKTINVWSDPWLPLNPPRPARGPGKHLYPHMTVADLLQQGSWKNDLIEQLIDHEDSLYIKNMRPSVTGAKDILHWIYTNDGHYAAKSGYQLLRNLQIPQAIHPLQIRFPLNIFSPLYGSLMFLRKLNIFGGDVFIMPYQLQII